MNYKYVFSYLPIGFIILPSICLNSLQVGYFFVLLFGMLTFFKFNLKFSKRNTVRASKVFFPDQDTDVLSGLLGV